MNKRFFHKALSVFLTLTILMMSVPSFGIFSAAAADTDTRVADVGTLDGWKTFFQAPGSTVLSTKNAGGVWTDKSVFTALPSAFSGTGITMSDDTDAFLVALSVMAANSTVTGYTQKPTDTVFVLDVSGSMDESENGMADEMVAAANDAIAELFKANPNNRVGVVLYSGSSGSSTNNAAAVTVLPLDRYTTAADGVYLAYSDNGGESISLDRDVCIAGTTRRPTSTGKDVYGATYIQKGIYQAMDMLTAATTSLDGGDGETVGRIPVMVLMTDGAPTLATTDFTAPGQYNMGNGNGSGTGASEGFVTQLTAAYAKATVAAHYGTDCRIYTLGLGVDSLTESDGKDIALSVLDPQNSVTAIDTFWSRYQALAVNRTMIIEDNWGSYNDRSVTKVSANLVQNYVDRYFEATGTGNELAENLKTAFSGIVGVIKLQSQYYPTLIESGNVHLDGFVNVVDTLGAYMEVREIQGLLIGDHLFRGEMLSRNFAATAGGGALGTPQNPTALGNAMVDAVRVRLGLESVELARDIIDLAYEHGQLYYESDSNFSNYIGWYANEDNEFVGFWYEGMDMSGAMAATDAKKKPVFINRSYGFLGEVDAAHGVTESDMMYATVQVHTRIDNGETTMLFGVPAALIPLITYNVSLNENGDVTELTTTGATAPLRLVYEIGLREDINAFTVAEKVDVSHKTANGAYRFYANDWDSQNVESYENAYMYFQPSLENERYYFTEDTTVYVDTLGTKFSGTTLDENTSYYLLNKWYERNGNTYQNKSEYQLITPKTVKEALENGPTAVIPKDTAHHFNENVLVPKTANDSLTSHWVAYPFTKHDDEVDRHFAVATMGNNGTFTLTPETGLRLAKTVTETVEGAEEDFTFTITRTDKTDDNGTYTALRVAADGTETSTAVRFENSKAQVTLKDGDVLYIGGMADGATYTVAETDNKHYMVDSVNNVAAKTATVTVTGGNMQAVNFVNAPRTYGNLTIAKAVEHPFGVGYTVPNTLSFTIDVTLDGEFVDGTYNADRSNETGAITPTTVTVTDGKFSVTLKRAEQITVKGLPLGTHVTVTERTPPAGFVAPRYEDGGDIANDGKVTIDGTTASVLVVNTYQPAPAYPVNVKVEGTKTVEGTGAPDETFRFILQRYNGTTWEPVATKTAKHGGTFNFNDEMAAENYDKPGDYDYRVVEVNGGTVRGGMTYDSTVRVFSVRVGGGSMSGKLEIINVMDYHYTDIVSGNAADGWLVTTNFTNRYGSSGDTVVVPIKKTMYNPSESPYLSPTGFRFNVYDANGTRAFSSDTSDGAGYTQLVFDFPYDNTRTSNTFTYTVKENGSGYVVDKLHFSGTVYTLEFSVTYHNDGTTTAALTSVNGNTPPAELTFENRYLPDAATLTLDVNKVLIGKPLAADTFTFAVYDGDTLITEGKNGAAAEGVAASVTFDTPLTFDKVGDYHYTVKEVKGTLNNVTYDETEYHLHIVVTDNAKGQLSATYHVENTAGHTITFRNTYTPDPTEFTITATKELVGKPLLNEEFRFDLQEVTANGTVLAGGVERTASNQADGTIAFAPITYTKAGTHYYTVTEQKGALEAFGVKYDESRYHITVTVTDDGEGTLTAQVTAITHVTDTGSAAANTVVFRNVYEAAPTTFAIHGYKAMDGRELTAADVFTFELYASDAAFTQGERLQTTQNVGDLYEFDAITYKAAGTYYYLIKEQGTAEAVNGVTNDTTVYGVEITVTDTHSGTLTAAVTAAYTVGEELIPVNTLRFTNRYEIATAAEATLGGIKKLENKTLENGQFTFELYETDATFAIPADATALKTAKNGVGGNFAFETIAYTAAGDYYYAIREVNHGSIVDGIIHTDAVYGVKVTVADVDGKGYWTTTVTYYDGDTAVEADDVIFKNVYVQPDDATVTLNVEKTVKNLGDITIGPEGFEFVLTNTATDGKVYAKSNEDGTARFALTYTLADVGNTYTYTITETNEGKANIRYSQAVYTVTVTVSLTEDHTLATALTLDGVATATVTAAFENIHTGTTEEPPAPPQTGETTDWMMWIALLFVSGGVVGVTFRKRKQTND